MAGHPARNLSVRCAVGQSGRVICENSQRGSLTAMTSAIRAAAGLRSLRSKSRQGRHDTGANLQASSLRLLWRTLRHGDATLVGQQVLQVRMQKRLLGMVFAAVRACARARVMGCYSESERPSGVTERPSSAVVVLLQSGRDQPLFWAR